MAVSFLCVKSAPLFLYFFVYSDKGDGQTMAIARRFGIFIFSGVPAIMGGGIIYALTHRLQSVAAFEILLYLVVFGISLTTKTDN